MISYSEPDSHTNNDFTLNVMHNEEKNALKSLF